MEYKELRNHSDILLLISLILSSLLAQPLWINNSHIDGYLTGVGISNDKNLVSKRRIATVSARASLTENIRVEISSYFKMITTTRNDTHSTLTESLIEQKANEVLVASFVKDTYQDIDGTFYVLVVVDKSNLK